MPFQIPITVDQANSLPIYTKNIEEYTNIDLEKVGGVQITRKWEEFHLVRRCFLIDIYVSLPIAFFRWLLVMNLGICTPCHPKKHVKTLI